MYLIHSTIKFIISSIFKWMNCKYVSLWLISCIFCIIKKTIYYYRNKILSHGRMKDKINLNKGERQ